MQCIEAAGSAGGTFDGDRNGACCAVDGCI
jgi:hypothetical protein